jgi:hypothetical protein
MSERVTSSVKVICDCGSLQAETVADRQFSVVCVVVPFPLRTERCALETVDTRWRLDCIRRRRNIRKRIGDISRIFDGLQNRKAVRAPFYWSQDWNSTAGICVLKSQGSTNHLYNSALVRVPTPRDWP